MRPRTLWSATLLMLLASACQDRQTSRTPTQPDLALPPSPTPTAAGQESRWTVTMNWESYDGPDNCLARELADLPGEPYDETACIGISNDDIVIYGTVFDDCDFPFSGTLTDRTFEASGSSLLFSGWGCDDGTRIETLPGPTYLTGEFSADGTTLSAIETRTGSIAGAAVAIRVRWQGRKVSDDH